MQHLRLRIRLRVCEKYAAPTVHLASCILLFYFIYLVKKTRLIGLKKKKKRKVFITVIKLVRKIYRKRIPNQSI